MSQDNVEIELRIELDETSFSVFRAKAAKIATEIRQSHQIDEYFTPPHRNFVKPDYPYEWLSIRNRDGAFVLNYKHFYPENVPVTDYCHEYEVQTNEGAELRKILLALGFQSLVAVEKHREVYVCSDEFEIALDTVNDLGYFIEIEVLKTFGSVVETRGRLNAFAVDLGLDVSKNDNRGYPFLLMEKRGIIHDSE